MNEALLDTDIMSEVLKARDQQVLSAAKQYLAQHQRFAFSSFVLVVSCPTFFTIRQAGWGCGKTCVKERRLS